MAQVFGKLSAESGPELLFVFAFTNRLKEMYVSSVKYLYILQKGKYTNSVAPLKMVHELFWAYGRLMAQACLDLSGSFIQR